MSRLRRFAHLWRTGGRAAVTGHALTRLQARLGIGELQQRVNEMGMTGSTWALTGWVEQAAVDPAPLVSGILPTHNRAALLPRAVASVRAQAYPTWEIVLVDDGSTDDTPAVVEGLQNALGPDRLRSLRTSRSGGACAARNHALASAKGSLIAYLDDDDTLHPLWLKVVAWAFAQRPDVDVVYGGIVIEDLRRVNRHADRLLLLGDGVPDHLRAPGDHPARDRGATAVLAGAQRGGTPRRRARRAPHVDG